DLVGGRRDVQLRIFGDGPERPALEKARQGMQLRHRVRFERFTTDLAHLYGTADVFVLASDYEGFGNVLLEALAFGLPIVATDAPFGPRDVLTVGRSGQLTPRGSVPALAQAIVRALDGHGPGTPASRRARAAEFAAPLVARQLAELLEEL